MPNWAAQMAETFPRETELTLKENIHNHKFSLDRIPNYMK